MVAAGRTHEPPRPVIKTEADDPAHEYERQFGKPPHHRMKRETIIERLRNGNAR